MVVRPLGMHHDVWFPGTSIKGTNGDGEIQADGKITAARGGKWGVPNARL